MAKKVVKKSAKEEVDSISQYLITYEKGPERPYFKTTPSPNLRTALSKFSGPEKYAFILLIVITLVVRIYDLSYPDSVVFDEVHFLGFASKYVKGTYFVDVHPPLVKLIFFLIAKLTNYDGDFDYSKIGNRYLDGNGKALAPYVLLRLFTALCGVGTVLLTYKTAKLSGCRPVVCLFGALLCCFENSLITQSRHILLDSPMIFAISLVMFSYQLLKVSTPFSKSWFRSLCLLGFGLSLAISSKWVGFLTMLFIGILTLNDFWFLIGDLEVSSSDLRRHLGSRVYFLVFTPVVIYMGLFAVHFMNLPLVGDGTSRMSPQFQNTLQDSIIHDYYPDILRGSTVSLRHVATGGYLHSHNATYPQTGEQQVTLYDFQDLNNDWVLEPTEKTNSTEIFETKQPVTNFLRLKFFHVTQQRYLRVNDERPPISQQEYDNEVTLIGDAEYTGDGNNEVFELRLVTDRSKLKPESEFQLQAIDSVFQIYHVGTGCYLLSHDVKLPKWGFNQNEVICIESPTLENSLWIFEKNTHPILEKDPEAQRIKLPSMSFWSKLVEVHKVMLRINNGLTENHVAASKPISWPFLLNGVGYWNEDHRMVFFLGNYIIYWLTVMVITAFAIFMIIKSISFLNPSFFSTKTITTPTIDPSTAKYISNSLKFVLGWLIHYLPFFLMNRQLFLHHYLPSLYFGILEIIQTCEFVTSKFNKFGYLMMISILAAAVYVFGTYSPLVYGLDWTIKDCMESRLLKSWKINCPNYR